MSGMDGNEEIDNFGSIVLVLYNPRNNTVRMIVDQYHTADPFEHLHNLVNHFPHQAKRIALSLMRSIRAKNTYFKQLAGTGRRVRSALLIKAPCCMIQYENHSFISML
ncbi:hypothetical protein Aduo_018651 [Ancylostoma duodenale]